LSFSVAKSNLDEAQLRYDIARSSNKKKNIVEKLSSELENCKRTHSLLKMNLGAKLKVRKKEMREKRKKEKEIFERKMFLFEIKERNKYLQQKCFLFEVKERKKYFEINMCFI
jgi:hypothetical protein